MGRSKIALVHNKVYEDYDAREYRLLMIYPYVIDIEWEKFKNIYEQLASVFGTLCYRKHPIVLRRLFWNNRWSWSYNLCDSPDNVGTTASVFFKREEDALMFKLRFA